jgi:hypothetical protein
MSDRGERVDNPQTRRFREEEELGVACLAGWVGHPAVRPAILAAVPPTASAIARIEGHLDGQIDVIYFCRGAFGMGMVEPGWVRRSRTWMLTFAERAAAELARAAICDIARAVARELAEAGARVDPEWGGDLTVIAEIAVMEAAGFSVRWDLPPRELAEALQPPGISAIQADARGTEHRRGISERAERNAGALRRSYERHLLGPKAPAPYAHGGTRGLRHTTLRRLEALRAVLTAFPNVTAPAIRSTYHGSALRQDGSPATPGGYLRHLLGGKHRCPSATTLTDDLNALRGEGPR